jgi:ATP-dependent exoDNAse (exonuclease V) beta subunit
MSLPLLTVIPAGAGSGKTYTIQKTIAEWIEKEYVHSDRIVAVTFTETAAAELKQRISAELIESNKLEDARKLEQSYISTIHGFGMRLVTEFAFDAGISPSPRLLNDDEQKEIIKKALANTTRAEEISQSLKSFGYNFDFNSKKSAEDIFRASVLNSINVLRSLGWNSKQGSLIESAKQWLSDACPDVAKDEGWLNKSLQSAVEALLDKYPDSLVEEFGVNKTAKDSLRSDFTNLVKAKDVTELQKDWKLWRQLQQLRITKLPADYVSLAEAVMTAAENLKIHPGPLAHEMTHITGLLEAAEEVLERYETSKVDAGLVDYTDMIAMSVSLLATCNQVFDTLKERIDCVIVDEFQDTNPLQFSLVWMLTAAGIPTLIVGDVKQAIMGFQGADPRLFDSVQKANSDVLKPLDMNWRTQRPLMEFLNDVSAGLFPQNYQRLTPKVEPVNLKPLVIVEFDGKTEKGVSKPLWYASHIVEQISTLLDDSKAKVKDRNTEKMRSIIASDVAILAPTHTLLSTYRDVLSAYGIRANIQQDGWYGSRIIQLMLAVLSWLADSRDRHAALYLSVTELGAYSLEEALGYFIKDEMPPASILETLEKCRENLGDISVPDILGRAIADLDIYNIVLTWPDAEQVRANLLRLQDESYEFVMTHKETLASGGFYGSGIQTFLSWLESKVDEDDKQPAQSVVDEDAVVLKTWHASKGLEWPVVIVAGLYKQVKPKLPDLSIGYHSFTDLQQILKQAHIKFSPNFDDPNSREEFIKPLLEQSIQEANRLLYVALTRAREKLILEWPSHLQTSEAEFPHYWKLLSEASDMQVEGGSMMVNGVSHSCRVVRTDKSYPDSYTPGDNSVVEPRKTFGRVALKAMEYSQDLTPSFLSPSQIEHSIQNTKFETETIAYGSGINLDLELSPAQYGDFIHRCIELLLIDAKLKNKLDSLTGIILSDTYRDNIASEILLFQNYLNKQFPESNCFYEIPINGLDKTGTVITGIIDLLIEDDGGYWIIDHKSDRTSNLEESFASHLPQLMTYKSILDGVNGKPVLGVGIHWVRTGELTAYLI